MLKMQDARHVILPKPLLKMVPRAYFSDTTPGVLRLLTEDEWRNIGITQSPGWVHYEVHGALGFTRCSAPDVNLL